MSWALAADAVLFVRLCVVVLALLGPGLIVAGNLPATQSHSQRLSAKYEALH